MASRSALPWGRRTLLMGIVNATPDSFSGDGCGDDAGAAVALGLRHAAAGADILDIGGASSRPGAQPVPEDVEIERVAPVIAALAARCALPLSVDTFRPAVAEAALRAGATIVNDVWGLRRNRDLASVARAHAAALVIVHNREAQASVDALGGMYPEVAYADLVAEVAADLREAAGWAADVGLTADDVWLDPGLGFGKTPAQSLELLRRLPELRLGHPLLVGPSRKSFIGRILGLPPAERVEGTAAAVALSVAGGADVVRIHDVGAMARVAAVADAVVRGWPK